jgi:hypothetical protein
MIRDHGWYKRWVVILPVANLLLALVLAVVGDIQARSTPGRPRYLLVHTTLYYAPAVDLVSFVWNAPALILSKSLILVHHEREHRISSIPPEDNTVEYALSILLIWFVIGWSLDRSQRLANRGHLWTSIVNVLGAAYSLFLLWVGIVELRSNVAPRIDVPVFLAAIFVWGVLLLCFFSFNLFRAYRQS